MSAINGESDGVSTDPVLAFFDVDNTLMRGASLYHVGSGAYRRGYVNVRDLLRFAWQQACFIRNGENLRHVENLRERGLQLAAGIRETDVAQMAEEIFDRQIQRRLWPESVGLTREHMAKGHQVWLVTATPWVIADVIARRLGLTGALGTRLETKRGVYTGRLEGSLLHGASKAVAARALADDTGSALENCWAYSDSRNDIPLLELAGNRVVVNPDTQLLRHASTEGWSVLQLNAASIRAQRREVRREAKLVTNARASV